MKSAKLRLLPSLLLTLWLPAAVAAGPAPEVLATYGESITLTTEDFDAALLNLPANLREDARKNPKTATRLLEDLLVARVLAEQARTMGLDKNGETQAQIRQMQERVLAIRRMQALEDSLSIPDYTQAAREQYEIDKAKFVEPEQVHVAHVLIGTRNRSEDEALKLAQDIRAKALAGEDFAALAAQHSEDPGSRTTGGDLGFFGRKRMIKPFEDASFAMAKPGQISEPVKTTFGYHIIKFIERKPERQKPFEEVKEGLIQPMRNKLVNEEKARLVSGIRNHESIKLNTDAIDRLIGIAPKAADPKQATAESATQKP